MHLRNRDGTPVDPVPFLVVALLGATISYAWGPMYLVELGLPFGTAVAGSTGLCVAVVAVAFRRYVWLTRPEIDREVPPGVRFQRLVYAMVIGVIVIFALVALGIRVGGHA